MVGFGPDSTFEWELIYWCVVALDQLPFLMPSFQHLLIVTSVSIQNVLAYPRSLFKKIKSKSDDNKLICQNCGENQSQHEIVFWLKALLVLIKRFTNNHIWVGFWCTWWVLHTMPLAKHFFSALLPRDKLWMCSITSMGGLPHWCDYRSGKKVTYAQLHIYQAQRSESILNSSEN